MVVYFLFSSFNARCFLHGILTLSSVGCSVLFDRGESNAAQGSGYLKNELDGFLEKKWGNIRVLHSSTVMNFNARWGCKQLALIEIDVHFGRKPN